MITVRCDSGNRSPISVSEKVRALVPLNHWVCHIDGGSAILDDSESIGNFGGKLLAGFVKDVVAVEAAENWKLVRVVPISGWFDGKAQNEVISRSSFSGYLVHAQQHSRSTTLRSRSRTHVKALEQGMR